MRGDELLLEDVCSASEEDDRREAVQRVFKHGEGEACKADLLVEKRCREVEALFCGRDGVLK